MSLSRCYTLREVSKYGVISGPFSRIRTEYGEKLRMRENKDQK